MEWNFLVCFGGNGGNSNAVYNLVIYCNLKYWKVSMGQYIFIELQPFRVASLCLVDLAFHFVFNSVFLIIV